MNVATTTKWSSPSSAGTLVRQFMWYSREPIELLDDSAYAYVHARNIPMVQMAVTRNAKNAQLCKQPLIHFIVGSQKRHINRLPTVCECKRFDYICKVM